MGLEVKVFIQLVRVNRTNSGSCQYDEGNHGRGGSGRNFDGGWGRGRGRAGGQYLICLVRGALKKICPKDIDCLNQAKNFLKIELPADCSVAT